MVELVKLLHGNVFSNSVDIAKSFGKIHRNVIRDIESLDCSEEFSLLNFEQSEYTNNRGKTYKCYNITRDGFSFLCMGFTGKKSGQWKEKYINAFNQMESALLRLDANAQDNEWLKVRSQSKQLRLQQTDVIKEFVEYATNQGSKSAKFYYKHYTNATYKALGLIQHKRPKLKDTLDMMELSQLMVAENVAKQSIIKHMEAGEHYKSVFLLVKQDLLALSETLLIN